MIGCRRDTDADGNCPSHPKSCVLELEAGQEINELVARYVMMWKSYRVPMSNIEIWRDDVQNEHRRAPNYSFNLEDAMDVVYTMQKAGFSIKMFLSANAETAIVSMICSSGPCVKHGTTTHNHHGSYDVEADTLELAICRAALAALSR